MREYFRPYNKVIDIADANQHNVLLTDTSGGLLDCNFVSVTVVSGGSTALDMFQVIPSGINTMYGSAASGGAPGPLSARNWGPSAYNNANARTSNSASGSLGLVTGAAGTVILSLAPYDVTNAVIITQSGVGAEARYGITYGHVSLANQVADNNWNMGEKTYPQDG